MSIAAPWPGGCGEWLPAPRGGGGHGGIPDHVVDSITDVPTCRRESGNRPSIKGPDSKRSRMSPSLSTKRGRSRAAPYARAAPVDPTNDDPL